MTNQYALGYKAGLEVAKKACQAYENAAHEAYESTDSEFDSGEVNGAHGCMQMISRLPVPEVQWRDLTDQEIVALEREVGCFAVGQLEAVIAKFKEKQLPTNSCQNSTELVEPDCAGVHHHRYAGSFGG